MDHQTLSPEGSQWLARLDHWSGRQAGVQLDCKLVGELSSGWWFLTSPQKLKVMCAFLHIPIKSLSSAEMRHRLRGVLEKVETDHDDWVSTFGRLLSGFFDLGAINPGRVDSHLAFRAEEAVSAYKPRPVPTIDRLPLDVAYQTHLGSCNIANVDFTVKKNAVRRIREEVRVKADERVEKIFAGRKEVEALLVEHQDARPLVETSSPLLISAKAPVIPMQPLALPAPAPAAQLSEAEKEEQHIQARLAAALRTVEARQKEGRAAHDAPPMFEHKKAAAIRIVQAEAKAAPPKKQRRLNVSALD
mmetsp:Transcript_121445/g.278272  ORF Transcript_121445/g.278272 Transcript_121445/m.278272 type:complete len:303 (+) Transcript_121445:25-933(+)